MKKAGFKVIMPTGHDQTEPVQALLTPGAYVYCLKGLKIARLIEIIHTVMEGARWLDPPIARLGMNTFKCKASQKASNDEKHSLHLYKTHLTEPKWAILDLIAKEKVIRRLRMRFLSFCLRCNGM